MYNVHGTLSTVCTVCTLCTPWVQAGRTGAAGGGGAARDQPGGELPGYELYITPRGVQPPS